MWKPTRCAIAGAIAVSISVLPAIPAMASGSPVSGIYKDRQGSVSVSGEGFGISGVRSSKKDSSPCQLSIFERPLSGTGTSSNKITLNECPTIKSRSIVISEFDDPNIFVRGLAVCLSKEKVRHLKPVWSGVRLYGARVEGGEVTSLPDGSEIGFERFLCQDWREPVMCPEGEIVTGITAHIRKARVDDKQITGLGISCNAPKKG